jgi:hypothetical protein
VLLLTVAAFIVQTRKNRRDKLLVKEEAKEWVLSAIDRCDSAECGAQAYVKVTGVTGDLFFCSHHYNRIVDNAVGYDKMMKFAFNIIDEREKLVENRLKQEG